MRPVIFVLACLSALSAPLAAPIDRVVGISAPEGSATLVKRVQVAAGDEITGVLVLSNDVTTVFPAVRIRRQGADGIGAVIAEAHAVRGNGRSHRIHVATGSLFFLDAEDLLVEVELPPTDGITTVGAGAGLGATHLDEPGPNSYTGHVGSPDLQPLDTDLCVTVLRPSDAVLSKAGGRTEGAGDGAKQNFRLQVAGLPGCDPEIEVDFPGRGPATLDVYDVRGKFVRNVLDTTAQPRSRRISWDRRDAAGVRVAGGVYVLVARADGKEIVRKTLVLH